MQPRFGPVWIPQTGHNRYCGPAAISIITGVDTAEAARMIRSYTGKHAVMGTHYETIRSILYHEFRMVAMRNYEFDKLPKFQPTLNEWVRKNGANSKEVWLINAGHHWIVTRGRYCCDNQSGQPMHIKDFAGKCKKVKFAASITNSVEFS